MPAQGPKELKGAKDERLSIHKMGDWSRGIPIFESIHSRKRIRNLTNIMLREFRHLEWSPGKKPHGQSFPEVVEGLIPPPPPQLLPLRGRRSILVSGEIRMKSYWTNERTNLAMNADLHVHFGTLPLTACVGLRDQNTLLRPLPVLDFFDHECAAREETPRHRNDTVSQVDHTARRLFNVPC